MQNTHPDFFLGLMKQDTLSGTVVQYLALVTKASASIAPNPNFGLTLKPPPFVVQFPSFSLLGFDVYTMRYCMSLQVKVELKNSK